MKAVYELAQGHHGKHTYSHRIRTGLYRSTSSFIEDVEKLDRFICDNWTLQIMLSGFRAVRIRPFP